MGLPHASPSVRKFARELGVPLAEMTGSGPKGRITEADVQAFTRSVMAGTVQTAAIAAQVKPAVAAAANDGAGLGLIPWPKVDFAKFGPIERKEMSELAKKARDGKLSPAEMSGASFTISSLGGIGGRYFTPIINAPEVAILGVCRSQMEPVWDGKAFQPRLMLPLSLTWDHRVIDGAAAARFNVYLSQILGDFRRVLL